ncbi:hypothetical protein ACPPVO_11565 [Dactylosporangium sp. McL0621]|uniref:hypothetical protein n=1 Tax=Dactylosporangium sp. McL0621 TaxID=3415678 RepID=UPI003CF3E665
MRKLSALLGLVLAAVLGLAAPAAPALAATTAKTVSGAGATGSSASTKTLVLYDYTGQYAWLGEDYGMMATNLVSHFGAWTAHPVGTYTAGELSKYSAVVYVGSTYDEPIPTAFLDDVLTTTKPVVWLYDNIWQLTARSADFATKYGYTWKGFDVSNVAEVDYKGTALTRDTRNLAGIMDYAVYDSSKAVSVADAVRADGTKFPWGIKSGNLTYIGEIPFSYITSNDRYLAFSDLFYDVLAPQTAARRRALRRAGRVRVATRSPVDSAPFGTAAPRGRTPRRVRPSRCALPLGARAAVRRRPPAPARSIWSRRLLPATRPHPTPTAADGRTGARRWTGRPPQATSSRRGRAGLPDIAGRRGPTPTTTEGLTARDRRGAHRRGRRPKRTRRPKRAQAETNPQAETSAGQNERRARNERTDPNERGAIRAPGRNERRAKEREPNTRRGETSASRNTCRGETSAGAKRARGAERHQLAGRTGPTARCGSARPRPERRGTAIAARQRVPARCGFRALWEAAGREDDAAWPAPPGG